MILMQEEYPIHIALGPIGIRIGGEVTGSGVHVSKLNRESRQHYAPSNDPPELSTRILT